MLKLSNLEFLKENTGLENIDIKLDVNGNLIDLTAIEIDYYFKDNKEIPYLKLR